MFKPCSQLGLSVKQQAPPVAQPPPRNVIVPHAATDPGRDDPAPFSTLSERAPGAFLRTVSRGRVNAPRDRSGGATRLAFLAAGFSMGCWSPLIPFARTRLGASDAQVGLLLLSLGVGSIAAMPATAALSARLGTRPIIMVSGLGLTATLPLLASVTSPVGLAGALLLFGALIGTLDVAMNVHAVEVERASAKPLMSGFHALYSVGGLCGSGGLTFLLSKGLQPLPSAVCGSIVVLVSMLGAAPHLLRTRPSGHGPLFVVPHGTVLLLAALAAAAFLTEGAILDWGALLIMDTRQIGVTHAGVGYLLFSVAMTLGRLSGDRVVALAGARRVLFWGGLTTVAGFLVLLVVPPVTAAMTGFLLIGFGASNIVPVLFSQAGRQRAMPPAFAVAALTTTGYAGILAGPAAIGYLAHVAGLARAFWLLGALMCLLPLSAARATRAASPA